ncbi:tetratricopeptide repeat protein [Helicobacter vulpis]|uniref:tetratricopeptide repeat protein n=1 Tax=Helicobacter vulpis TaxID=2316076 RepID=UPI000EB337D9|nr:tetratricopeptide repeat protein [Helicobacter vulpis]
MSVVLKKRVWQVILLLAVALGVCYAGSQADEYFKLAESYYKNKDYSKALQYLQKAADMGDALAYTNLGVMYAKGKGVGQDKEMARRYFEKACDLGVQVGCKNLKALAP